MRALSFLVLTLTADAANAQSAHPESPEPGLFAQIEAADSALFGAFNDRDLDALRDRFTRDLEFYHDQTGLTSYEQNMESFASLFARGDGLRRDLVPGSLRVYPAGDGGAIQVGEHRFCHTEAGAADCGTFPFVMIWRHEDSMWRVSRVVSYGH